MIKFTGNMQLESCCCFGRCCDIKSCFCRAIRNEPMCWAETAKQRTERPHSNLLCSGRAIMFVKIEGALKKNQKLEKQLSFIRGWRAVKGTPIIERCIIIKINYNTASIIIPLGFCHWDFVHEPAAELQTFSHSFGWIYFMFWSLGKMSGKARNSLERPLGEDVVYRRWQIWRTSVLRCWAWSLRGVPHCFCWSGCSKAHPET